MKTFLKILAIFLLLLMVTFLAARHWLFSWDEISPPQLPGTIEHGALVHQGHERQWLSYVPANNTGSPPLLLFFRGSGADGAMARSGTFYRFDELAEKYGFVVVYPTGYERHWNGCRKAGTYSANLLNIDDVGYVRSLVAEMVERYGVDPGRIYAAGMSNGGHMVYRLAFEAPDLLAGAAAVMANLPAADNLDCQLSDVPVPMFMLTGTEDAINPYEGGDVVVYGESRGAVQSALASARYWATLAGYSDEGQLLVWPESNPDDGTAIESLSWQSAGKASVTLVTVRGGGHTFPHPTYSGPRILGRSSHEVDAAELVWSFFSPDP